MAITYPPIVRNARMQAVADAIDSGNGRGSLVIGTAGMEKILVVLKLNKPCAIVRDASLRLNCPIQGTAVATGTAASAQVKSPNGNVIIDNLTVGTGSADINLGSDQIHPGHTVHIESAGIIHG